MQKTAVFTIISKNYWAFARTLMQSLASVHPEWDRHALLVDRMPKEGLPDDDLFTTTSVEDLALPNLKGFLFRYTIMEMNTAAKPWMFEYLRNKGYQRIIYLDPDILVIKPMVDVEQMLEEGATAVLTPHLTAPLTDDRFPTELAIMRSGTYNLGFLAVGNTPQSDKMISWWQQKLEYQAVVNLEKGLFTDQKWIDLVPGLFEGVSILRDSGYNTAYWNLSHRPLTREGEDWYAGGRLLRFFHFSGLNPEHPGQFSKHQNRFNLESLGVGKELALQYAGLVLANGHQDFKSLKYAFGYFDDGTPIPDAIRAVYRENRSMQEQVGTDPFTQVDLFAESPQSGLAPLLQGLLHIRPDMGFYFPDPEGLDRQALLEWFIRDRGARTGISEKFINPIRQMVTNSPKGRASWKRHHQNARSWGGVLEYLHYRMTGAPPSFQRIQQYRSIHSMQQFLAMGHNQAQRYFRGRENRLTSFLLHMLAPKPAEQAETVSLSKRKQIRQGAMPQKEVISELTGVNIIGYVRSEHGVGQSPRLSSVALQAVGQPHVLIDFNIGNPNRTNDTSLEHLIAEHPRYPVNVFHINADQMPVACRNLPPDFLRNRYNIGFWHWELPELPDMFLDGFQGLDEVWVPTSFVHDAVSKKSSVPVIKIPHAIQFSVSPCSRSDFGLPDNQFLFLTMYDFSSYQERKNPKGALDAFDRAFDRKDNRIALVIKTQNSHHHPQALEELQAWLEGRENVVWLDQTLTRQEVYNLESLCDCYLSLHRSEGFGLGPAEAMYLGKPVIATNWSGTTEFMRQDNSLPVNYELIPIEQSIGVYERGQIWANPDIEHAAQLMRKVADDRELCQRIGLAAQQSIHTELSPLRIGKMQQERLNFIKNYFLVC